MKQKTVRIWYWIVTILFALFMVFSGGSELLGVQSAKDIILGLGYPLYLNIILGVAKILGVVAILQTKFKTIKEWAYAGFAIDIIGAAMSFALHGDGVVATLGTIPFLAVMFVSYWLWKKTG